MHLRERLTRRGARLALQVAILTASPTLFNPALAQSAAGTTGRDTTKAKVAPQAKVAGTDSTQAGSTRRVLTVAAGWIARALGLNDSLYAKLTQVRGDSVSIVAGTYLAQLDLSSGAESVRWQCSERCWSPAPFSLDTIAFVTRSGLWVLASSAAVPTLRVADSSIVMILGRTSAPDGRLLVARRTAGTACAFGLAYVDESQRKLVPASWSDAEGSLGERCLDLRELVRRSQIRGDVVITTTVGIGAPEPRGLRQGRVKLTGGRLLVQYSPVEPSTSSIPSARAAIERFDPAWMSATSIVYVARPWP